MKDWNYVEKLFVYNIDCSVRQIKSQVIGVSVDIYLSILKNVQTKNFHL